MLELIKQRRIKDKFKREFGTSIEDFFDDQNPELKSKTPSGNTNTNTNTNKEGI